MEFEVICVNTKLESSIKNESNLLHFLLSSGDLWDNPEFNGREIKEKSSSLKCKIERISDSDEDSTNNELVFKIRASGSYDHLEKFRLNFLSHIDEKFDYKYVTQDEVSKKIACKLYPLINDIESRLRGYLITFFVSKLGVKWWDLNADDKMKSKANQRKNNEKDFSKYIDNKFYLIDFRDLGEMVYSQSSGYTNIDEILKKIEKIDENDENFKEKIQCLKEDIKTNYNKFFKKFKDGSFQNKWQTVEKIRNKVAHNNLFTKKDLELGESSCSELLKTISEASKISKETHFSKEEQEKIVELSLKNTNSLYGEFIKNWQQFRLDCIKLFNNNLDKGKVRLYQKGSNKMFNDLRENHLISDETYKEIMSLSTFRNKLVHTPNDENIEKSIPEMIGKLDNLTNTINST